MRHRASALAAALSVLVLPGAARAATASEPSTTPADAAEVASPGTPQENAEATEIITEEIVVTAGRTEQLVGDVPVKVTVLDRKDVERSPAVTTDDLLREVPGFNLQRPDSSRVLNLSSQAVSYRGLGGTSASRSLVLVDGVPLNEPFAGWISWSRVPLATVERIEIVPGGAASVWGNQALGGVIHLITRRPQPATLEVHGRYGSRQTMDSTILGSHVVGPVAFAAHASHFETDGFSEVPAAIQGPADTTNRSRHTVLDGRFEHAAGPRRWTLHGNFLEDEREGGNVLFQERLQLLSIRAAADVTAEDGGFWHAQTFTLLRDSSNTRGSFNDDRTAVEPRRDQFDNPSESVGASLSWSRPFLAADHLLSGGLDAQWTDSEVNEDDGWDGTRFTERFRSGGEQLLAGVYLQDSAVFGQRWRLLAGGRVDRWQTSGGEFFGRDLVTGEVLHDQRLRDRSELVFSPNLGARYEASEHVSLRGSLFQSFRAPSPNELFKSTPSSRTYRAANSELEPERVVLGFEAGADYARGPAFTLRVTGFWNEIEDAIIDMTVGVAGDQPEVIEPCGRLRAGGVCEQRQNLDGVRNRGLELDVEARPAERWRLGASYTLVDSKVTDAPNQPVLEGKWLQRVPEHQATLQASYEHPRLVSIALQARYQGERYEEDLNELLIGDALLIDLVLSRRLAGGSDIFATVENLLDTEVEIGNNGDYVEVGQPRYLHFGFRYRWRGR